MKTGENHYSFAFTYAVMALGKFRVPMDPGREADLIGRIGVW